MEWKQIFIWIFVFIVGSLIVSFLIYPQSFQSFKSNVQSLSISKAVSGIGTISLNDLTKNKDNYIDKEITIRGNRESISAYCALDTCCNNLHYSMLLYEEDKVTIPSSKFSMPIKMPNDQAIYGTEWKCQGKLKKSTFDKLMCSYFVTTEQEKRDNNCDAEPTEDCYYFEASSCECLSDYC